MATRTYRYRIYPNKEQAEKMARFFGCARKVYNLTLAWWKEAYKQYKEDGTPMGKTPNYAYFKAMPEYEYLKECDSVALANATLNFKAAIDSFLKSRKGHRDGKPVGFPKFKRKGVSKDTYTTFNNNNNAVKLSADGRHIRLPKLGDVKIVLHRPFAGLIKSANVSRSKSGNFHVSLTVETTETEKPLLNRINNAADPKVVGLDMSMKSFVVSSDLSDVTKPKYAGLYRKNERKLARLQRQMSRKQYVGTGEYRVNDKGKQVEIKKPSKNREKAQKRLAKFSERLANQRREFIIQTALHFVRNYDVVVIEDLDMQNMSKSLNLGKSVHDLAFGEFRQWLEHEAMKYDCYVHTVDRWFASSKTCSGCGYKNKDLKLSDREWTCPECGSRHDRDFNAAVNLMNEFIDRYNTAGTAEFQACGDGATTLREFVARVLSNDPATGRKQETLDALEAAARTEARDFSRG
jgi:putative transposase